MPGYDALVVGAGFAGAAMARLLAEQNRRVLVIERQNQLGGAAADFTDPTGILVHRYGPHIFHTNNRQVFQFLSRFTHWNGYIHRVAAKVHGNLLPVPFNLQALQMAFGTQAPLLQQKLFSAFGPGQKVTVLQLLQNPDPDLAKVANYIYNNLFLEYTKKQWGLSPTEIDPATINRVPVVLSEDDRYFTDHWQGLPAGGYTALFKNMLQHPFIEIRLETEAKQIVTFAEEGISLLGQPFEKPVIYTGAIDELLDCRFGPLPYRTIDFVFESYPKECFQTYGVVNYTVEEEFTRITEYKHLTGQHLAGHTTISKEYPKEYTGTNGQIPFYPVASGSSAALYKRYAQAAAHWPNLHLLGRLAQYRYFNIDTVLENAFALFESLK